MAIDLQGLSSVNAGTRSKASATPASTRETGTGNSSAPAAQTQPETVKLSSEAQLLSKLEEQLGQLPDTNQDRIAHIKQAIAEGSYSIDAGSIAAKLTQLEGQLFS